MRCDEQSRTPVCSNGTPPKITYSYDDAGNPICVADPNCVTTVYGYNT